MNRRPKLLVTGMAPGFGVHLSAQFAAAGYDIVGMARSDVARAELSVRTQDAGGAYIHLICDAADAGAVDLALAPHLDDISVWVHNAQSLVMRPFAETSPETFEAVWRASCLSAAVTAGIVLPVMARHGRGTAILSGATASLRGGARFSAFASAKFALRGLGQSLGREYAPKGVRVVHVVIDGLIEAARTDVRFGPATGDRILPGDLAARYLDLARQPASCWTGELDVRPKALHAKT